MEKRDSNQLPQTKKEALHTIRTIVCNLPDKEVTQDALQYILKLSTQLSKKLNSLNLTKLEIQRAILIGLPVVFKKPYFKKLEERTLYYFQNNLLSITDLDILRNELDQILKS